LFVFRAEGRPLGSILNRIIFWELVKIFLLSLVGITGILLLAVVVVEAQNQGLGPMQILAIIPLAVPSTLPYTIPATTLFATCVVYGRLAHDNEILAVKAAGINILHIVKPALLLGLTTSVATSALYYDLIPGTYHRMKTIFLNDVENVMYTILKRQGQFSHAKVDYVIYVKRVEGRTLVEAQFMHRDKKVYRFDVIARAQEAELRVDQAHHKLDVLMRHCYITSNGGETAVVEEKIWPIDLPPDLTDDRRYRQTDMTWPELGQFREELREKVAQKDEEIALNVGLLALNAPPAGLPKHIANLRNEKKQAEGQIRTIESEMQRRPAIALGCLCFVLVGCPVGIWFSRSDYLSAFVICFLPIVIIYYPLILCGENLSRAGKLDPLIALWAADALMGVVAAGLYARLLKN
jgi:lipopolysaccharide export system permease protein